MLRCALSTQIKGSIVMDDEKEKPTGCEAYLVYVSDLWGASAEARRAIVIL